MTPGRTPLHPARQKRPQKRNKRPGTRCRHKMRLLGRITKRQGYDGSVVVKSDTGIAEEPQQGQPVFVVTDGIPVPFFVREASLTAPGTMILSFDGYLTAESVSRLCGCDLYTEEGDDENPGPETLAGFTLYDLSSGITGIILRVMTSPGQLLAEVRFSDRKILVPLHPDLITSVDRKKKRVIMTLPEGLGELND